MAHVPRIRYFLADTDHPVHRNDALWSTPLPVSRSSAAGNAPGGDEDKHCLLYSDYFNALQSFLEKNKYDALVGAVGSIFEKSGKSVGLTDLETLDLFLEKHGAFYHPARVETVVAGQKIRFAVNVAVSGPGRRGIIQEYTLLKRLHAKFTPSFLPAVYYFDQVAVQGGNQRISMFMAEWLEDFYEFHGTVDKTDGERKIAVWNADDGALFLSTGQEKRLYREIAKVLTSFYDLESFRQVYPWHHAAGDFIVQPREDGVSVRLITVRNYVPIIGSDRKDPATILHALLIFLLSLSIRTRLDRLDGVGEVIWAGDSAVSATVSGFFKGLALKPPLSLLPETPANCFQYYTSTLSGDTILDLLSAIVENYPPGAPERALIKRHLKDHAERIFECLNTRL